MSNLSGWSMLWISLSITCVIATVFQLIQAKKSKKADSKKSSGDEIALTTETFQSNNAVTKMQEVWA